MFCNFFDHFSIFLTTDYHLWPQQHRLRHSTCPAYEKSRTRAWPNLQDWPNYKSSRRSSVRSSITRKTALHFYSTKNVSQNWCWRMDTIKCEPTSILFWFRGSVRLSLKVCAFEVFQCSHHEEDRVAFLLDEKRVTKLVLENGYDKVRAYSALFDANAS